MEFEIHKAENLSDFCEVLREARQWMLSKGLLEMWDLKNLQPDKMVSYLEGKEALVAKHGNNVAGVIVLQWHDPRFWPEVEQGSSIFFHRLAVKRAYAGKGASTALLKYVENRASEMGLTHIRFDCSALHAPLKKYYESKGYTNLDRREIDGYPVNRFVKVLGQKPDSTVL